MQIAGRLSPQWAERLGLKAGIPIPVGAFDAHWDAIGAGCRTDDVVNVVGTSTCIIGITPSVNSGSGCVWRGAGKCASQAHRDRGGTVGGRRHLQCHRNASGH